jgi:hypothetical protein
MGDPICILIGEDEARIAAAVLDPRLPGVPGDEAVCPGERASAEDRR